METAESTEEGSDVLAGRKGALFFGKGMVGKGMGGSGFGFGEAVEVLNRAGVME